MKEEAAGKPIGFEGFIQSEDITNEEAINALKKIIDTVEEDTVAVSLNSEDVEVFKKASRFYFMNLLRMPILNKLSKNVMLHLHS